MEYGLKKELDMPYEKAIEKVKKELSKEGFGVLTQIDIKATLKKKLDIDFDNYIILGACNPSFAYKALQNEQDIGLLLPCNIIVYEKENKVYVNAINPSIAMGFVENSELDAIAKEVREKLVSVIYNI